MTVLDQAFIKAYAKDQPMPLAANTVVAGDQRAARAGSGAGVGQGPAIEQIYHDGALYRLESPSGVGAARVAAPHVKLPPTSPRRSVRRSLLKHLAHTSQPENSAPALEMQRVARKVIIRHIGHPTPAPSSPLLRAAPAAPVSLPTVPASLPAPAERAELPPETLTDKKAEPALPVAKPPVPLNEALSLLRSPQVIVANEHHALPPLPSVIVHTAQLELISATATGRLAREIELSAPPPKPVVDEPSAAATIKSAPMIKPATPAAPAPGELAGAVAAPAFVGKSLDDTEGPKTKVAIDPPHALATRKPHARFAADEVNHAARETNLAADDIAEPAGIHEVAQVEEAAEAEIELPAPIEEPVDIGLAEPEEAALASDLVPHAEKSPPNPFTDKLAAPPATKPAAPTWEVDRFHLPKACERLLADREGYFATAGDKLAAAVRDGLRVLAISGSRRGEGRTTLAICLAHAAAKSGLQVALMDCDFARPQLASKIGLDVTFGWQDAAVGKVSLSEAAIKSVADSMTALPLEPSLEARSLSLADPRVTATIRAAAATFELLILDLGPLAAGEELSFPDGEKCPIDAAIVVRDLRFASAVEAESIGHAFQDAGVEAVGIAENFVSDDQPAFGD